MSIAQNTHGELENKDMMSRKLVAYFSAVLMTVFFYRPVPLAMAQEMEVIAGGELEYQNYCAVCHGADSRGQGIMGKYLTVRPADLTQLAKKNRGEFPFWQVYRMIDGRDEVRGHGSRDMPVWGDRFRSQAGGSDPGARAQAAGRLLGLVFYLQHIQER
jgi:mono/diheme cytochrome c family protein